MPPFGENLLLPFAVVILIFGLYVIWRGVKRNVHPVITLGKGFTIAGLILWFRTIQVAIGSDLEDHLGQVTSILALALIGIGFVVLIWFVLFYPQHHPFQPKMFTLHCMDCGKPFQVRERDIATSIRCPRCIERSSKRKQEKD